MPPLTLIGDRGIPIKKKKRPCRQQFWKLRQPEKNNPTHLKLHYQAVLAFVWKCTIYMLSVGKPQSVTRQRTETHTGIRHLTKKELPSLSHIRS